MSKKYKLRLNLLDFIIILVLVLVCVSFAVRRTNVMDYITNNNEQKTVITLSVKGLDRNYFSSFNVNDTIYGGKNSAYGKIGSISKIKSTPSIITEISGTNLTSTPDFKYVDLSIDILADCMLDENGFYTIGGQYIAPATSFVADNGKIKFDCVVVSVAKYNK